MPLKGIPDCITPELLYALARMGHGDFLVIADANFPSDSIATAGTTCGAVIRVHGTTADILAAVLTLIPLDMYVPHPVAVMDRVQSDKDRDLHVPAYAKLAEAAGLREAASLGYVERHEFYAQSKKAFVIVQTDDRTLYANAIVYKGVL